MPDALSRREQDKTQGEEDDREQGRFIQLIPAAALSRVQCLEVDGDPIPKVIVFEDNWELQELWDRAAEDLTPGNCQLPRHHMTLLLCTT